MQIVIYTWKSRDAIDWGKWQKNIQIRQMPFSRFFQDFFSKIFYRIWIMIDRPEKILINFLYHGEKSLPKNMEYYYILHSPASQVPHRYHFIKNHIHKFKNISFIAVSQFVMREAEPFINKLPVKVIYNGVDTKYFSPNGVPTNNSDLVLVTLSALESRKGIQNIITAIIKMNDPKIRYNIYGDGPYKQEIVKMIKSSNLQDKITLHPSNEDPAQCLNNSDVYMLLSKGEAFPLGPLEAMACGLPVIVSDHPPYDEFVHSDIGFKVNRNSTDSISEAIYEMKILANRSQLGAAGRKMVEKSFTWEHVASRYYKTIYSGYNI
jgi:glycosyltransferase involved in cell wall biosynthesis